MRLYPAYDVLKLLEASKDAGWVIAMVLICVTTFAVSSVFVNRGFKRRRKPAGLIPRVQPFPRSHP
jgi:hypothetical protein